MEKLSMVDHFSIINDPRIDRCKKHNLLDILVIASPRLKKLKGNEFKDAVNSSLEKAVSRGSSDRGFSIS